MPRVQKWDSEYLHKFDVWKNPVRGKYSYYFSHNHHGRGGNVVLDPALEWDSRNNILFIHYQIIPSMELDEDETIKDIRHRLHNMGIEYDAMITHIENLWTKGGIIKYSFKVYLKWNHLPENKEIKQFETMFRLYEK